MYCKVTQQLFVCLCNMVSFIKGSKSLGGNCELTKLFFSKNNKHVTSVQYNKTQYICTASHREGEL